MTGRTPLYVAVDMNSFKGGALNFGVPIEPPPPSKATAMDVVNRLLKMGVDPNHELDAHAPQRCWPRPLLRLHAAWRHRRR